MEVNFALTVRSRASLPSVLLLTSKRMSDPCCSCCCLITSFVSDSVWPHIAHHIAHQVPLSMEFSKQEYWSGLPCSPPGDLSSPGIKPWSSALQATYLPLSHQGSLSGPWKESEVAQSCPTLCDPVDCSLPSSSVHGILQARILEWVTISFSRGSSQHRDRTRVSRIGGRCFNLWATREAHFISHMSMSI